MLYHLEITNFALIASLELELGSAINVFSGETGAGKSILLDALAFLLGARGQQSWIRSGSQRMRVAGSFILRSHPRLRQVLEDLDLWEELANPAGDTPNNENEDRESAGQEIEIQLWRELQVNGRNTIRVNGQPVTVAALRALGSELMELQGQQETLRLLQPRHHLQILDQFGDALHQKLLHSYQQAYLNWQSASKTHQELQAAVLEASRNMDIWRLQDEEITQVKLQIGEEERLFQRQQVLLGKERLYDGVSSVLLSLTQDGDRCLAAATLLHQAKRELEAAVRFDSALEPWVELVDSLYWQLDELGHDLTHYRSNLEGEPGELEDIARRLDEVRRILRKYGATVEEVLRYQEEIRHKQESWENQSEELQRGALAVEEGQREVQQLGMALGESRREVANFLQQSIMVKLQSLLMERCRFAVNFTSPGGSFPWRPYGGESCEFLIAPNPGEPLKPLAQIASGGELARILLALKTVLVALDMPDIMIFDEPDSGLSGSAVKAVAAALAQLGEHCQLLLVTHQAAVATVAKHHYYISKASEGEETFTYVELLNYEGRLQETMRLLAADPHSKAARDHAAELLKDHKKAYA
ncbi:MAG: DNA repair protein RecN [Symbiobacteriaceae bacterium]|nr:DNA repair protein RecN [Symbiobacteriaceae bacterium]